MTIIGHPKNFSKSSLTYFENFVKERILEGNRFLSMIEYINSKV